MEELAFNYHNPVIHLRYSETPSSKTGPPKCSVCDNGFLLLPRNDDLVLGEDGWCAYCGQRYIYDDIDELRKSDIIGNVMIDRLREVCNCGLEPKHPIAYHDWCCQVCGGSHIEKICPVATEEEKALWNDRIMEG